MQTFLTWLESRGRKGRLRSIIGGVMPTRKVKHSLRVGDTVARSGLKRVYVDAAILHDYIERGGDPNIINKLGLSDRAKRIIWLLTNDEKTKGKDDNESVYQHVMQMLNDDNIDQKTRDVAIIIKASDRLDNLRKRLISGKLTEYYFERSLILLNSLISYYRGNRSWLAHIRRKYMNIHKIVSEYGFANDAAARHFR